MIAGLLLASIWWGVQLFAPPPEAMAAPSELEPLPPVEEYYEAESFATESPLNLESPTPANRGFPGERRAPLRVTAWGVLAADVRGTTDQLSASGEELSLGFPVRIAPGELWLALGGVKHWELSTAAVLPDSGLPLPDRLWDIKFGLMQLRDWQNGWQSGLLVQASSPSDRPFESFQELSLNLLGFVNIPAGPRDAWSLSLFYSPTGQVVFPLPGLAYVWRPSPQLTAQIGVPFSLEYQPTEQWLLTASYRPLTELQLRSRYQLDERWAIWGGYAINSETYLLADRSIAAERLYLFDQRFTLALERQLGRGFTLELAAAQLFDRKLFQAERFSGERRDQLHLAPAVGFSLQLAWYR